MATEEILNALANAVIEGDDDLAEEFAQKALDEGVDAYEAIVDGLAKGMNMVIKQFSDGLVKLGLEFIPVEGEFDPAMHEAVTMEPVDDESKDGHIIGALCRGYKLAGRVLKAPQVRVGKYNG